MASVRKRRWSANGEDRTAWIVDYFDQHGRRHIKTSATKHDAEVSRIEVMHEVSIGLHTARSGSITIAEIGALWVNSGHELRLERSTIGNRKTHLEFHIRPLLGGIRLSDLTTPMVERFATQLRNRPFGDDPSKTISLATAKKILASLKAILRHAQRTGNIARNPAEPVTIKVPTRGRKKIRPGRDFPTKDEVRQILIQVSGRWRPLIVTAVLTGMRSSELRGLTWDDVDFEKNVIRVRQRADAWGTIDVPKSEAGEREIPMMPTVCRVLEAWRSHVPRPKSADNPHLVFPNGRGNVESHSNIVNRCFAPLQLELGIAKKAGLGPAGDPIMRARYGLHTLRHFFATYMIERGVQLKRLQGMLGHSSFVMTMDTYGHLFESPEADHALMSAADTALVGGLERVA